MTSRARFLLADVGGTNARFASVGAGEKTFAVTTVRCDDYASLFDAATAFLQGLPPEERPQAGAFAVASPVTGDRIAMTNRNWSFSVAELKERLGFEQLNVINDFVAVGLSVPHLDPEDVVRIGGTGTATEGEVIGVLGPGTGLGVAGLVRVAGAWVPLATEGGHVTMAPFDDRESEILRVLRGKFDHVSAERLLSGQGLTNIHRALSVLDGQGDAPLDPAVITEGALKGMDSRLVETVAIFCRMLGTAASNLALTLGARGGIYIAGGIVPKLGRLFETSGFRQRFEDKGRFRAYLAPIPTLVVTHKAPAFIGLRSLAETP